MHIEKITTPLMQHDQLRGGKTSRESWNQTENEAEVKVVIDLSVSEYFYWIEYWDFLALNAFVTYSAV